MKKKIAILGSTGSIGKSTLDIIKKDKKNFDVILLTANNNYKQLIKQANEFKVKHIPYLADEKTTFPKIGEILKLRNNNKYCIILI